MFEHLQYRGALVSVKSPAGKKAEEVLDFNDGPSVEYRQFVIDMIAVLERDRRVQIETIRQIERAMSQSAELDEELVREIDAAAEELSRIERNLARLAGTP